MTSNNLKPNQWKKFWYDFFFTGALSEGRVTLPTAGVWDGAGVL